MIKHVILWKLKDDVVDNEAVKRGIKEEFEGFFRCFDPRAVVVVAPPGELVENRALAHLTGSPCVFGLGGELIDPPRFKCDVQGVCGGRFDKERERGQGEILGASLLFATPLTDDIQV